MKTDALMTDLRNGKGRNDAMSGVERIRRSRFASRTIEDERKHHTETMFDRLGAGTSVPLRFPRFDHMRPSDCATCGCRRPCYLAE